MAVKSRWLVIAALSLVSCSPIRGCVESQFTLEQDSRLPKWFALPSGYSRANVTVQLTYYAPPFPADNALVELQTVKGSVLYKTTGEVCWHPVMETKKNQHGGFNSDSYPHYVYLRANNVTEVIEHIQGPTFRISDDPVLVKAAMETKRCNKG